MSVRNSKSIFRVFARMMHRSKKMSPEQCGVSKVDKVTICGAASPFGQTLALLLKQTDLIREVHLYDETNLRGVALDLDHIDTPVRVRPNSCEIALRDALRVGLFLQIRSPYQQSIHFSFLSEASGHRGHHQRLRRRRQLLRWTSPADKWAYHVQLRVQGGQHLSRRFHLHHHAAD